MEKLTCQQAKDIPLVKFLETLGYWPVKIQNENLWFLSPLREEKTASFKVNTKLNVWYDHGLGKGGDIITFGTLYYNCTISELLSLLSNRFSAPLLSFHQQYLVAGEKKNTVQGKVDILDIRAITNPELITYLHSRAIPFEIADKYCKEVEFRIHEKKRIALGFLNNSGGYELRSRNFKGSSSPKDVTLIKEPGQNLTVIEGFFSFLSYQVITSQYPALLTNCLVLNSLSNFEKSRTLMESYDEIYLMLDRDQAGIKFVRRALEWNTEKYKDRSQLFFNHKDLNDWLTQKAVKEVQQRIRRGL